MLLTSVTQADSELERVLAKSPDSALHVFGDCSHGGLRLGVHPQLALIFLGPGPPFHLAPGSFYSLFLSFGQLRISTVGLNQLVYGTIAATLSTLQITGYVEIIAYRVRALNVIGRS
jgi:hypothetical protein